MKAVKRWHEMHGAWVCCCVKDIARLNLACDFFAYWSMKGVLNVARHRHRKKMTDDFYRAFEDRFRGDQDTIEQRLKVYWPHVQSLTLLHPDAPVLDLGCGRGEWLRLMREHGVLAKGIDLDVGMLQACEAEGLDVTCSDAFQYLSKQPDASVPVISAFHVVEHLPFQALRAWLDQALRVLVPGGLLILETPNPENIQVGTCNFYLDPTHQRPIPPALLDFMVQHHGFEHACILRLQEDPHLNESNHPVSLKQVLTGASPDYAVLARKPGASELHLSKVASKGIDSQTLASRWQAQQDSWQQQQEKRLEQQEQRIEALVMQNTQVDLQIQAVVQQVQNEADQLRQQLLGMHASTSWRITAPMRWVGTQLRRLRQEGLRTRIHAALRKLLRKAHSMLQAYPRAKAAVLRLTAGLRHSPRDQLWHHGGAQPETPTDLNAEKEQVSHEAALTTDAQQIFEELQRAIQNAKETS
ncbi:MAG: class I SAM-dependent methyltransferase [Limnohabitans sp.]